MQFSALLRSGPALALIAGLVATPAHALVSIDDGKNQLYTVSSISYAWDSNIFANSAASGDSIYSASVGLEYVRRAGLISFNGSMYLDASSFVKNTGENFTNPRFHGEFTKQTGRTTGSLTLGADRQSRADTAANLRSESWLYDAGLNIKYPVIERYTISAGVGYSLRDFVDNSLLVDLTTYSANVDLFYVYNSERDIIAGYRVRYGETSAHTSYYDHAFTAGISGKVLPKISGTLRAGYQFREPNDRSSESFQAVNVAGSLAWTITKRVNATIQLSKDFSTTSTNIFVDANALSLDTNYAVNSKTGLHAGLGYGVNRFLGTIGDGRVDSYFTWNVGANYTLNSHLKLAIGYTYFQNWSSLAYADFIRNSVTVSLSSKF